MSARQLPESDYFKLRAATRRLVKFAGNGSQAALITRVSQQRLSEYGQPEAQLFIPIDVVADLEAECGPVVTTELAALSNYLLVPMPEACRKGAVLGRITGEAMKETSEVFITIADIIKDGVVTGAEVKRLSHEIDEALAKLVALKLQVAADSEAAE
ncbi:phage regulatory CII family protein [Devosia sp. XGJD_8]|uniref:phage regulatory CII family protein n=1 Tax=Devosia sp. XGJD_8 TaxID=3391187 RepID=UPI003985518A